MQDEVHKKHDRYCRQPKKHSTVFLLSSCGMSSIALVFIGSGQRLSLSSTVSCTLFILGFQIWEEIKNLGGDIWWQTKTLGCLSHS